MATSTITDLTGDWTEIATGAYLVIQNIGNNPIRLFWGDTEPTATAGFELYPTTGVDNTTFGDGPVWARASNNVGKVIVNV